MSDQHSQWIFTEEELTRTPSALEGMGLEEEREKRGKGCNFILQVGIALKLPQLTLSTASTFLHRFYMRHSVQKHHYYDTGATALYLATKVEENMRKFEALITECVRVAQKNPTLIVDKESKEFWKWRDVIIEKEELLLEAICFDMTFEQPYTLLISFTSALNFEKKLLMKTAWSFVNDSYMTMLCLLYPSRTIAAAAMYCAAKHCKVEFEDQDGRPWWDIVGVKLKDIKRACNYMASVYENNPLRNETVRYVSTPESADSTTTRARSSQKTPVDVSPSYSSQPTYSNGGSRGSSIDTGSAAGKRLREGSEEGEEISTPVKKQRVDSLLASPREGGGSGSSGGGGGGKHQRRGSGSSGEEEGGGRGWRDDDGGRRVNGTGGGSGGSGRGGHGGERSRGAVVVDGEHHWSRHGEGGGGGGSRGTASPGQGVNGSANGEGRGRYRASERPSPQKEGGGGGVAGGTSQGSDDVMVDEDGSEEGEI